MEGTPMSNKTNTYKCFQKLTIALNRSMCFFFDQQFYVLYLPALIEHVSVTICFVVVCFICGFYCRIVGICGFY